MVCGTLPHNTWLSRMPVMPVASRGLRRLVPPLGGTAWRESLSYNSVQYNLTLKHHWVPSLSNRLILHWSLLSFHPFRVLLLHVLCTGLVVSHGSWGSVLCNSWLSFSNSFTAVPQPCLYVYIVPYVFVLGSVWMRELVQPMFLMCGSSLYFKYVRIYVCVIWDKSSFT